jgi:ferrous iron transport protein A
MHEVNKELLFMDKLKPGDSGIIAGYEGEQELHYRLRELGLVRGTRIKIKRCAPLGDPMEILLRGYSLSLRRQDASKILVELKA